MRKLFFLFLGFTIMAFFSACSSPTSSSGSTLVGKWIFSKSIIITTFQGETHTEEEEYDPAADNYYEATIFEFKQDSIIVYHNNDGTSYYSKPWAYTASNGKLIVEDDDGDIDTVNYSFESGKLVFTYEENEDGESYTEKEYFSKYTGDIPPSSWVTPLTNDSYEPDNDLSSATSISVGGSAQNHVIVAGDADWFKFQATSGTKYLILITGHMDNVLYLYDNSGNWLAEDDDNDNDYSIDQSNVESAIVWTCYASGDYYFMVNGYDWGDEISTGYYSASVSVTSLGTSLDKSGEVKRPADKKKNRDIFFN